MMRTMKVYFRTVILKWKHSRYRTGMVCSTHKQVSMIMAFALGESVGQIGDHVWRL